jgi:hypothetical protein
MLLAAIATKSPVEQVPSRTKLSFKNQRQNAAASLGIREILAAMDESLSFV